MATYTKVSRSVPNSERAAVITAVADGDRIDLVDVLGRPARRVIFKMTDSADTISYKLNHLRHLRPSRTPEEAFSLADQVWGISGTEVTDWWSSAHASEFTGTGSTQLEIADGLQVSALEITGLSLSTGTTITIEVT
jgi:hypothetical protein